MSDVVALVDEALVAPKPSAHLRLQQERLVEAPRAKSAKIIPVVTDVAAEQLVSPVPRQYCLDSMATSQRGQLQRGAVERLFDRTLAMVDDVAQTSAERFSEHLSLKVLRTDVASDDPLVNGFGELRLAERDGKRLEPVRGAEPLRLRREDRRVKPAADVDADRNIRLHPAVDRTGQQVLDAVYVVLVGPSVREFASRRVLEIPERALYRSAGSRDEDIRAWSQRAHALEHRARRNQPRERQDLVKADEIHG